MMFHASNVSQRLNIHTVELSIIWYKSWKGLEWISPEGSVPSTTDDIGDTKKTLELPGLRVHLYFYFPYLWPWPDPFTLPPQVFTTRVRPAEAGSPGACDWQLGGGRAGVGAGGRPWPRHGDDPGGQAAPTTQGAAGGAHGYTGGPQPTAGGPAPTATAAARTGEGAGGSGAQLGFGCWVLL